VHPPDPSSSVPGFLVTDFAFAQVSRLAAPAAVVWSHATSMTGVNRELWPLVRMTHPRGADSLADRDIVLGERVFRSWILFLGVLPIDYDDLTLIELEAGRRFLERSPMLSQKLWCHERRVEAVDGGCLLEDRVSFVPRVAMLGRAQLPLFRFFFRLRHQNLRRLFGSLS
jgi:ligand-binding SRPBCC domain-containing protein